MYSVTCFYLYFILIFSFWLTVQSFKQTDENYLSDAKGNQKDAGSTASTAVLIGDQLFVANVGDSRAVACKSGSGQFHFFFHFVVFFSLQKTIFSNFEFFIQLCHCQLITNQIDLTSVRELKRLVASSSGLVIILTFTSFMFCIFNYVLTQNTKTMLVINTKGTWRVGGVLAVSRAFGDKLLKPYVVADPEIQVLHFS